MTERAEAPGMIMSPPLPCPREPTFDRHKICLNCPGARARWGRSALRDVSGVPRQRLSDARAVLAYSREVASRIGAKFVHREANHVAPFLV